MLGKQAIQFLSPLQFPSESLENCIRELKMHEPSSADLSRASIVWEVLGTGSRCVLFVFVGFWAGPCRFRCFVRFYVFCSGLGCSRCVLFGFGLVYPGFAVLFGFMYFVLVSAALAAFLMVLCGFGLVSAGFAVMYFVLVSAALAAFCLVLYIWLGAGLCWFRCFVWFYVFCAGLGCSRCVLFGFVWFWAGVAGGGLVDEDFVIYAELAGCL